MKREGQQRGQKNNKYKGKGRDNRGGGVGSGGDRTGKKPFKKRRKKPCIFCQGKSGLYTNQGFIRRFISDRGKILPNRMTGCCAKHQRLAAKLVKRARQAGVIAYAVEQ